MKTWTPSPRVLFIALWLSFATAPAYAQAEYNYHAATEALVMQGRQALITCHGLFVSNRTLEQVYSQELKLHETPILPPEQLIIDEDLKVVTVGLPGNSPIPPMRAAYRDGLGCIVLAPHMTTDDIADLPEVAYPFPQADAPWPQGDLVDPEKYNGSFDKEALEAAANWAFDRETYGHPSQITISLLVVHNGEIVYEKYANGFDMHTRTRTWSTAKSIAATLIGLRIAEGKLGLDDPLPIEAWEGDARSTITLRNALHMASGLTPEDNEGKANRTGSGISYFAGSSSATGAIERGLVRTPGTHWDYENYDTLLGLYALRSTFESDEAYQQYPYRALFEKIGMRNTLPGVDRFGDFVMSSQVYTNARDLARLGLLHLNRGQWEGEQLLPESWVDFVRTPAPATAESGNFYGGQWWLPPDDAVDVPQDAYSTAGHRGQYTVVVPSYDLIIVRRGLDWRSSQHTFSQWDLTREVIKAFSPPAQPGKKHMP